MARCKPRLISLGMFVSLFAAASMSAFVVFDLFGPEVEAYRINDQVVDRETFRVVMDKFRVHAVVTGAILLATAYGFWKDRTWSRIAALSYWVLEGILTMNSGGIDVGNLIPTLIPLGVSIWYFFYKPSVVAYYRAIATKAEGPPVASSSTGI